VLAEPRAEILGAYRLESSASLLSKALDFKYGSLNLKPAERADAERHVRDELGNVVLFELLISNRDERFSVDDFGQPGSDQAAYDEAYLSLDGERAISEAFDTPGGDSLRVCFYLHFVDTTRPLKTTYSLLPIPALKPIPDRLQKLVPYEPVD
jgi:hypothetical protein